MSDVVTLSGLSRIEKTRIGINLEGWYVDGSYNLEDRTIVTNSTDINGGQVGISAIIAHGDLGTIFSYRKGTFDVDLEGIAFGAIPYKENTTEERKELELLVRYLLRNEYLKNLTPYVYGGINRTTLDRNKRITLGAGTSTKAASNIKYDSLLSGVGVTLPLGHNFGIRGDIAVAFTKAKKRSSTAPAIYGNGIGWVAHGTVYWNLTEHLSLEVGVKHSHLEGGDAGYFYRTGAYGSIGISWQW